jgi:BRCA1-associated protein
MPGRRYFYHLKFELYDSPTPALTQGEGNANALGRRSSKDIRLPPPGTDIFTSKFPVHTRRSPEEQSGKRNRPGGDIRGTLSETQVEVTSKTQSRIIDCGPSYACEDYTLASNTTSAASSSVSRGGLQKHFKEHTAELAVRDWRFGLVRVESLDMSPLRDRASSASIMTGLSHVMSGGSGGAREAIPRAKGGINAGPRSHTTKARFEPLDAGVADGTGLGNTELGWGIVHLYRDGEETPGLGAASGISQSPALVNKDGVGPQKAAGKAEPQSEGQLDTTILCIPAVPSYMTPSDFLGWVGEKTREEVSHFRMVMTERMNRYLVLMKFRDAEFARKWRQEWDGRVFGGLEVCSCLSLTTYHTHDACNPFEILISLIANIFL